MQRSDTTPTMQAHYNLLWHKLSPSERFLKGISLIMLSRQLLIAGIRHRFPDCNHRQLLEIVRREFYSDKLHQQKA